MTKGKAILLGIFTIWPAIYMFVFPISILIMVLTEIGQHNHHGGPPLFFLIIFPLHILTILETFVLIAIYIIHLFKTELITQDKKALWAVVLFLGNAFAMPVFWYLYIWKNIKSEPVDSSN